ncbi:hypothetical protein HELRODRAFT_167061 [Helobdella robusta]|uniref:EF-hand domain-containing protein n=1 Tax=Helobdella robusta TaxID=6412 RepID=T1EYY8_HELRO|nr:hypothetical protein HELRODRAFT_167061 [Helobdella robusta]ESO10560.1 hypothetical protein HELRODRAFT_167061 [Helobdella robusta]
MAHCPTGFLTGCLGSRKLHTIEFISIWTHYDKDASGYLDRGELDMFLIDLLKGQKVEITDEVIQQARDAVLSEADQNHDGKIELGEFAKLLPLEDNFMKRFACRKSLSQKDFNDIFRHYDPDGNGYIEGKELMALIYDIMNKTKQKVTLTEVLDYKNAVISVFDKNTDGRLSKKELSLLLSVEK